MACGSCGRRKSSIQVKRPSPIIARGIVPRTTGMSGTNVNDGKKLCPMCRSVMRSIHRYDKSIKRVIRNWYCTKPSCSNSKGSYNE